MKRSIRRAREMSAELRMVRTLVMEGRATKLAGRMMFLYRSLVAAGKVGTFVEFVRLLDPSVPTEKGAYKWHATYQQCDYMRRLAQRGHE